MGDLVIVDTLGEPEAPARATCMRTLVIAGNYPRPEHWTYAAAAMVGSCGGANRARVGGVARVKAVADGYRSGVSPVACSGTGPMTLPTRRRSGTRRTKSALRRESGPDVSNRLAARNSLAMASRHPQRGWS